VSIGAIQRELGRVIRGSEGTLELIVASIVAGGHILLEDLPGTGKTTLVRAIAALISGGDPAVTFRRIQCTPDLLPYDITGVDVYDPARGRFVFRPGPVFSHLLLVDEINRATPKVQSALLEVMNEGTVTIGGRRYALPDFFVVVATENPLGMEGTYPLPLAELDRFSTRLRLGYPTAEDEERILIDDPARTILPTVQPVTTLTEVLRQRILADDVYCSDDLIRGVSTIVRMTREHEGIAYGASPRGGLHLLSIIRALALIRGRDYANDEDLEDAAVPVLAHRIRTTGFGADPETIVASIRDIVIEDLRTRRRASRDTAVTTDGVER
jgi:MoxR-like ATPase